MPKVTVKWGGEKLDVEADLEQEPLVFKSQLFGLTGVPPDRQKVMFKVCSLQALFDRPSKLVLGPNN